MRGLFLSCYQWALPSLWQTCTLSSEGKLTIQYSSNTSIALIVSRKLRIAAFLRPSLLRFSSAQSNKHMDHIDRNPANNSSANLRLVDFEVNLDRKRQPRREDIPNRKVPRTERSHEEQRWSRTEIWPDIKVGSSCASHHHSLGEHRSTNSDESSAPFERLAIPSPMFVRVLDIRIR